MRSRRIAATLFVGLLLVDGTDVTSAAVIAGNSLALKSTGSAGGTAWTLDRNGFVGTYVTLANPGDVTIGVHAVASGGALLGIAVADEFVRFEPTTGVYSHKFTLPAGTHFVRLQLDNDRSVAGRSLQINSVDIFGAAGTGATVANSNTNALALAASDTYIANYRKGSATVRLPGVAPGQQVQVSMRKLAFGLGASIDWEQDDRLSGSDAGSLKLQQVLRDNFNLVATNSQMWRDNESSQGSVNLAQSNQVANFAAANGMDAKLHNMLWDSQQPNWVNTLKSQAVSSQSAKNSLRNAIRNRIAYYIAGQNTKFGAVDLYNESLNNGQRGGTDSYWNLFGAAGIADIYAQAKAVSGDVKLLVNDYYVLEEQAEMNAYMQNVEAIRQAALDAGQGEVVDGIGLQYYQRSGTTHQARNMMVTLQNASIQGLPLALSEFGSFEGVSQTDTARILDESLRLVFGTPLGDSFVNWSWVRWSTGDTQWAAYGSLYEATGTSNNDWANMQITDVGRAWQDRLGIVDHDGNAANGWNTQTTAIVDANGVITFEGYYGDYVLSVNGVDHVFTHQKGGVPAALPGDYNEDGLIDSADYTTWRDKVGTATIPNRNPLAVGPVGLADYNFWRSQFGRIGSGAGAVALPEPTCLLYLSIVGPRVLTARRRKQVTRPTRRLSPHVEVTAGELKVN